jgi:hypothetical protein
LKRWPKDKINHARVIELGACTLAANNNSLAGLSKTADATHVMYPPDAGHQ